MVIVSVKVETRTRHAFYLCMATMTGWKCGKCLHGLVKPKVGSKCKVCGAKVVQIWTK